MINLNMNDNIYTIVVLILIPYNSVINPCIYFFNVNQNYKKESIFNLKKKRFFFFFILFYCFFFVIFFLIFQLFKRKISFKE